MAKVAIILIAFVLPASDVSAYRAKVSEDYISSGTSLDSAEEAAVEEASGSNFCQSARCDGYTDADGSEKKLWFRGPNTDSNKVLEGPGHRTGLISEMLSRTKIASEKGYDEYHHGELHECKPITGIFSDQKDWASHMQAEMAEGGWPNQPSERGNYFCAEMCKLKRFNEQGEQINKDAEEEIAVERGGHSGDLLSKLPFVGWAPKSCSVGTNLQSHWWKQQFTVRSAGTANVMEDADGLPVYPFTSAIDRTELQTKRLQQFEKKFCALTAEQKKNLASRVTTRRPNRASYGTYYGKAYGELKRRNFFPRFFPEKCDEDGWERASAPGVVSG